MMKRVNGDVEHRRLMDVEMVAILGSQAKRNWQRAESAGVPRQRRALNSCRSTIEAIR